MLQYKCVLQEIQFNERTGKQKVAKQLTRKPHRTTHEYKTLYIDKQSEN